jgi:hypothetical protein
MKYVGTGSGIWYGLGIYGTSAPHGAYKFARGSKAIFVCDVALGRARVIDAEHCTPNRGPPGSQETQALVRSIAQTKEEPDPTCGKFDSRVINNPGNADLGCAGGNIKSEDETVIFNDDAMIPRYLILLD